MPVVTNQENLLPPTVEVEDDTDFEYTIEEPVTDILFEPEIEKEDEPPCREGKIDFEDRAEYVNLAHSEGMSEGAVVVSAKSPRYLRTSPDEWGIITRVNTYTMTYATKEWAPITVNWTDGTQSYVFHDELILVNFAPNSDDLDIIRNGGLSSYV